jgi:hypothetical protein
MNRRQKLRGLDRLIFIRGKYLRLQFALELDKRDASAIEKANRKMAKRIDDLRSQLHDDWAGSADSTTRDLQNLNNRLQTSIREIERGVNVAENIVKAVAYVDRVLAITAKLLGA